MNYDRALEVLGLDGEQALTRSQVRRCYQDKLRLHASRRDPEEYQRLRAAFELVVAVAADDETAGSAAATEEVRQGDPAQPAPAPAAVAGRIEGVRQLAPGQRAAATPTAGV